ncbi:MAG: molecular chaperone DnaJ [archaeon]
MTKDYYKILGVEKNESKEGIKKAYKKLAKKYHPDISKEPDASDRFKEINEAAAVLGDDNKRAQYDQFGKAGDRAGPDFSGFDFSDFMSDTGGFDFDNIFDTLFGGGMRRNQQGPNRGSDLRLDMEIELEDVASGLKKTVYVDRHEECTSCSGSGAHSSSDIKTCDACEGAGMVRKTRRTPFGMFSTAGPCSKCQGQGRVTTRQCATCHGLGRVEKRRKIDVQIPAGIEDSTSLRITDEGDAGLKGGSHGDLYVVVHLMPHKLFERSGDDLYSKVPISFCQAVLGADVEVPALNGKATLKIPAGTQTHTVFRMRGKGIAHLHGSGAGDQMVKVIIQTPTRLTVKQKELLKDFARLGGNEVNAKSFFEKIKDAL